MDNLKVTLPPIISGYIAGSTGLLVGHPLDSLKVLAQTNKHMSSMKLIRSIIFPSQNQSQQNNQQRFSSSMSKKKLASLQHRSFLSLYSGVTGPLLVSGLNTSINFFLYDSLRRYLYFNSTVSTTSISRDYLYKDPIQNVFWAGCGSGALTSFFTSPFITLKAKQQVNQWNIKQAFIKTLQQSGGVRNFYLGIGPHFICESFGRGVYLTVYEYLKRSFYSASDSSNPYPTLSLPQRMMSASIAGIVGWTFVFPIDVVRNKMYVQKTAERTAMQFVRDMWAKGGCRPFFRGFGVTMIRAGPVASVTLPCYDYALEFFINVLN